MARGVQLPMDGSHEAAAPGLARRHKQRLAASALLGLIGVLLAAVALPPAGAICAGLLAGAMAAITFSDIDEFIIPDAVSLPAIPVGLLMPLLLGGGAALPLVWGNLLAATIYGGGFYLLSICYRAVRQRDGLGLGDVKLAAVAGAWTGMAGTNIVVLLACLAAIGFVLLAGAIRGGWPHDRRLPFGAFLAPAIWLVWTGQQAGMLP